MPQTPDQLWRLIKPLAVRDLGGGLRRTIVHEGETGVSDHGLLTGLGDDDHPHYLTTARGDARYPLINHDIIGDHGHSGAAGQLVGVNAGNTLAYITPVSDGKASPGVVLDTDANGDLTLRYLTADKVLTGVIESPTILLDSSVQTKWGTAFNSENYVSSTTGIGMDEALGLIDARKIQADEMIVESFTAAVKRALAGNLIVTVSESLTSRINTLPSDYVSNAGLYVWDIPGHQGMDVFKKNSWVQIPYSKVLSSGTGIGRLGSSVAYAEGSRVGTGTTTYIDEDFDAYDEGEVNTEAGGVWRATGNGNSPVSASGKWAFEDMGSGDIALQALPGCANSHCHYNDINAADVKVTGKFRLADADNGWGVTAYSQFIDGEDKYVCVRYFDGRDVQVSLHGYDDPTSGTTSFSYTFAADTWYQFRMEVETDGDEVDLRFRLWVDGDSEPGTWNINCTFTGSNRPQPGTVGFWAYNITTGTYYDDIAVTSIGTAAVPASATVTLNIDNDIDTHVLFLVSVYGSSFPQLDSIPSGLATPQNSGSSTYRAYAYHGEITTEDGLTSYTWTGDSNTDVIAVSAFTMRGLSTYLGTSVNVVTSGDWSIAGGADTGNPPTMRIHFFAKHGEYAGPWKKSPESSSVAAYNQTANEEVIHLIAIQETENDRYLPVELIDYDEGVGAHLQFNFSEQVVASGATGLEIGSAFGIVTNRIYPGDLEDGEQCWSLELLDEVTLLDGSTINEVVIPASSGLGISIPADTPVLNLGNTGDGVIDITTLDEKGAPYMQFALVGEHPIKSRRNVKMRAGQLKGVTGYDSFGFVAQHRDAKLEISSRIAEMANIPLYLRDGRTTDLILDPIRGIRLRSSSSLTGAEVTRTIDWAGGDNLDSVYTKIWGYDSGSTISQFIRAYNANRTTSQVLLQAATPGSPGKLAEVEVKATSSVQQVTISGDLYIDDGSTTNHFFSEDSGADSYVCADGGAFSVGNATNDGAALYIDNDSLGESYALRIKPGTFSLPSVLVENANNGTGDGPYIKLGYNNNGTTPAPSSIVLGQADGQSSTLWVDNNGNLREAQVGGEGINSTEISTGELVSAQTSSEHFKHLQDHVGADEWADALARVQRAAAKAVYRFTYKRDRTGEVYQGVVLERGAEHYGMDKNEPDIAPHGKSLNVVNAIGDLMQAVAELNRKLEAM